MHIHRVSKNVSPLACYNFDIHEWILIVFGRYIIDKVSNRKVVQKHKTRKLKLHFHSNAALVHCQNSTMQSLLDFFDLFDS